MNSIVNDMPKYDHHQHVLSNWLAKLDQRFQLDKVGEDTNKITWEDVKEALLTRLGIGSVRDEAWAALKNLKKGSKDIVELAGEVEKTRQETPPQRWGSRRASRCGRLLRGPGPDFGCRGADTETSDDGGRRRGCSSDREDPWKTKEDQIRLLKKDLKEANEQIAAHKATAPPVAAMAAIPAPTAATTAAAQPPPAAPARHIYQDYGEEPPFYRPPRCRPRIAPCTDWDGHYASTACPYWCRP